MPTHTINAEALAKLAQVRAQYDRATLATRLKKYAMTPADFDAMLAAQGGGCAICGSPLPGGHYKSLLVDHSHSTGKVRGLLCDSCNMGLGCFKDERSLLRLAADYLDSHQ